MANPDLLAPCIIYAEIGLEIHIAFEDVNKGIKNSIIGGFRIQNWGIQELRNLGIESILTI
jgi:hypothetical protein